MSGVDLDVWNIVVQDPVGSWCLQTRPLLLSDKEASWPLSGLYPELLPLLHNYISNPGIAFIQRMYSTLYRVITLKRMPSSSTTGRHSPGWRILNP